jgi:hypothetical protein
MCSPDIPSRNPVVASKSDKVSSSASFAFAFPYIILLRPGVAHSGNFAWFVLEKPFLSFKTLIYSFQRVQELVLVLATCFFFCCFFCNNAMNCCRIFWNPTFPGVYEFFTKVRTSRYSYSRKLR